MCVCVGGGEVCTTKCLVGYLKTQAEASSHLDLTNG